MKTPEDVDAIMARKTRMPGMPSAEGSDAQPFCINSHSLAQFSMVFLRSLFRTKQGMEKALHEADTEYDVLLALLIVHHDQHRAEFAEAWKAFLKSDAKKFMDPIWVAAKGAAADTPNSRKRALDCESLVAPVPLHAVGAALTLAQTKGQDY